MHCDRLWRNARLATLAPGLPGLGVVEKGIIASKEGRILYAGEASKAPAFEPQDVINCEERWITPGLIDCHTHLIYAGTRAREFEQRLAGVSYDEIARAGGGILSTVEATRAASEAELVKQSLPRLDALIAEGVTSVEVKSGYGLSLQEELRLLRAARALGDRRAVHIVPVLLGAHALPAEFRDNRTAFIELVCNELVPAAARSHLAEAVDVFCEGIGFSAAETRRVFEAARANGLRVKLHADQLSDLGGAALAAEFHALSADHLEYASEAGVAAMARAGTIAVLLPGAFYFLRETKQPPVALLRQHKVPIALATDCNPGTSPLSSLLLVINMGATLFRLTVEECIAGVTRVAANALGKGDEIGTIERGKSCDLAIWDIDSPAELVYRIGYNPLHARVWRGN